MMDTRDSYNGGYEKRGFIEDIKVIGNNLVALKSTTQESGKDDHRAYDKIQSIWVSDIESVLDSKKSDEMYKYMPKKEFDFTFYCSYIKPYEEKRDGNYYAPEPIREIQDMGSDFMNGEPIFMVKGSSGKEYVVRTKCTVCEFGPKQSMRPKEEYANLKKAWQNEKIENVDDLKAAVQYFSNQLSDFTINEKPGEKDLPILINIIKVLTNLSSRSKELNILSDQTKEDLDGAKDNISRLRYERRFTDKDRNIIDSEENKFLKAFE